MTQRTRAELVKMILNPKPRAVAKHKVFTLDEVRCPKSIGLDPDVRNQYKAIKLRMLNRELVERKDFLFVRGLDQRNNGLSSTLRKKSYTAGQAKGGFKMQNGHR